MIRCNILFEKENKQEIPAVFQEQTFLSIPDTILTMTSCLIQEYQSKVFG